MRLFCLILTILTVFFSAAFSDQPEETPSPYHPLIGRLSQEGFDTELLSKLFMDPRAELRTELMTLSLSSRETIDLYAKFLSPESILLSKTFLRGNIKILEQTEKEFQVDKEIIVAILLVESKFGQNIGRHRVLPTLASLTLLDSPENLRSNYQALKEFDPELSYERLEGIAKRRADRAYNELKYFLKIVLQEKIDPLEVKGSYAGAIGMAQFLPSSYIAFSVNRRSFEEWLIDKELAIISIANYLKSHGWKKNLSAKKKKQVIWYYNHSEPYVETIFQLSRKIKGDLPPPSSKRQEIRPKK